MQNTQTNTKLIYTIIIGIKLYFVRRGEASSDNDSHYTLLGSRFKGGWAKKAVTRAYECFVNRNKQFVHERRYE